MGMEQLVWVMLGAGAMAAGIVIGFWTARRA
jgi:uncharacterized protein YneF (UPF0154 family)